MGYYTRHELDSDDLTGVDHEANIEDMTGYSSLFDGETVKWYSHIKDMRYYSKQFPDVTFELRGEGEESGDIWIEYHRNGKVQECKAIITFEEFHYSKLK